MFRVQGLLKAGAMKPENKPLWFEVYQAFPPKTPPEAMRPLKGGPLEAILYPEDNARAMFYEHFGPLGAFDLNHSEYESECQKFVEKFTQIQADRPALSNEELLFIITKEKAGKEAKRYEENELDDTDGKRSEDKSSGIDISKLW